MNKYKIVFKKTNTYCIDVEAQSQQEAEIKANIRLGEVLGNNIAHHYEIDDPQIELYMVYDVTNTDDPFNP